ncbi:hypothetical protein EDEG_00022 [Edhazardia aedis USNM 41457]|uniref:DNA-directed DNA polymerase n=1 Tax=Edhazardia aedis (strain USNM 41457) TaxID=1003232 RepID=J8ZP02_EDHAE|nr:hypothetical protein EDEG_00022 [Edhazardia aedis USNM 41457]|eukprot:EJW01428.1 hypothetical protein EDEG_00022 [Edhazardia aedis USNM 41457]
MIASTKRLIEDKYSKKAGFTHDSRVIYGDTDSVMINFNEEDLKKVFELSNTVASYVSSTFIKPISLEFEKVYYPYLLMNKKRYAGLIYTNPQKPDKIDTKGIETVRRDNCEMVRTVVETCLDLILMKKDVEGAKNFVKNTVRDLYLNKIDLSQLVISKALTKEGSKYASKQAHVELAQKLKQRDAGNAPMLGDRIGYIIVKGSKGMAAYERSEDPVYVLENNIPIDTEYYLENQLSKPIYRLFEPILQNVMELTRGEHTRTVNISLPSKGPLTTFLTKKTLCIGCKTPGKILCNICMCNFSKHFLSLQKTFDEQKAVFAKCWTECQRCQGSVVNEILCVNRDCPIFYKRTKVKKDLVDLEEKYNSLKNFDW